MSQVETSMHDGFDPKLILLSESGEANAEQQARVDSWLDHCESAQRFRVECREIHQVVEETFLFSEDESTFVPPIQNLPSFGDLGFVNSALKIVDAVPNNSVSVPSSCQATSRQEGLAAIPKTFDRLYFASTCLAIVFGAISVATIITSHPSTGTARHNDSFHSLNSNGGLIVGTMADSSNSNRIRGVGDQTPTSKTKNRHLTGRINSKTPTDSRLLTKIKNSRTRIRTFKKRIKRRS